MITIEPIGKFLRTLCIHVACILLCAGCGGGTTGTSGTSELRLLGSVSEEDGSPVRDEPMNVIDEATQLELLASGTDKNGNFRMVLPRPALGVVVEIAGARTLPITTSLAGSVAISTSLLKKEQGELNVVGAVSASPRLLTKCTSFSVKGSSIQFTGQQTPESCTLLVGVESQSLRSQVKISLRARCNGELRTFAEDTVLGVKGLGRVDLSLVDLSTCVEARVEVTEQGGELTPILFEFSKS